MGNMAGYGLTARLISKHFGKIGDYLSEAIANFDPETATEVDRDNLAARLREAAVKLAEANQAYDKEHQDVVTLQALIQNDERVAENMAKVTDGSISDETITAFCDQLEANKARMAVEVEQETAAREFRDELKKIVEAISKQLADFDDRATKQKQALAMANAQKDMQALRAQQQSELNSLGGLSGNSTALSALARKADRVKAEAEAMRTVNEVTGKPVEQAERIDKLRAQFSGEGSPNETPAERLKRLAGK